MSVMSFINTPSAGLRHIAETGKYLINPTGTKMAACGVLPSGTRVAYVAQKVKDEFVPTIKLIEKTPGAKVAESITSQTSFKEGKPEYLMFKSGWKTLFMKAGENGKFKAQKGIIDRIKFLKRIISAVNFEK